MGPRDERVALNEATSREINERLEESHDERDPDSMMRIVCECGDLDCDRVAAISITEYEAVRNDPRHFVVVHDHVAPNLELVVRETERFAVVQKREGTPAQVAEEVDPRS
jgi:hypothetical protein